DYTEAAHDYIPPESPMGRLLGVGSKAAPMLVDAINSGVMNKHQKAWAFAVLISLTGIEDKAMLAIFTLEHKALGSHLYRNGTRTTWQRPAEDPPGGQKLYDANLRGEDPIDARAQAKLAARWKAWLDAGYLVVE
ncbi:MAG: hypothetical protein AAF585_17475, partial [Verrucomicrobiota bacterium]